MISSLSHTNPIFPKAPFSRMVYLPQANGRMLQLRRWIGHKPTKIENQGKANSPVILMLHGFGASTKWMTPLAARLLKNFQNIYALEMPSIGSAPGVKTLASPELLIKRVKNTVRRLARNTSDSQGSPRRVFVIGQSFGGLLATNLGANPPKALKGMVLLSPFFGVSDYLKDPANLMNLAFRYAVGQQFPEQVKELFEGRTIVDASTGLNKTNLKFTFPLKPETLLNIKRLLNRGNAQANSVTLPTLVFASGSDKLCDPFSSKQSFDRFASQDKTWVSFPNAPHNLVWSKQLDNMATQTTQWINGH